MVSSLAIAIAFATKSLAASPLPTAGGRSTDAPRGKGAPARQFNIGAEVALWGFQNALVNENWDAALKCCSPAVRAAATRYENAEVFLRATVPIGHIAAAGDLPVCGAQIAHNDADSHGNYYEAFVNLLNGGAELDIAWTVRVQRIDKAWLVDFPVVPLSEWMEQTASERHARFKAIRAAQMALIPEIGKISTRISVAGARVRAGEPILLRLELINGSSRTLHYDDQQANVNNALRVVNEAGTKFADVRGAIQTAGGPKCLQPGATVVLLEWVNIASQYGITRPGTYSVQFHGGGLNVGVVGENGSSEKGEIIHLPSKWPSNVVKVDVLN
jgi:hypothetical protein